MSGGPMGNSRLRGGKSALSEQGRSSGSSSLPRPHGQDVHDAYQAQLQPASSQGMHAPAMSGRNLAAGPDQTNGMPARSLPSKGLSFPSRPGEPVCDFYSKTGHCKFGEGCKFDHPGHFAVRQNAAGLPLRPGEPPCSHHEKTGQCKYGPACKFDHPERA